jgi:hypothetical protein
MDGMTTETETKGGVSEFAWKVTRPGLLLQSYNDMYEKIGSLKQKQPQLE